MATIRAGWKRTVQTRPYESEVIELAVELEVDTAKMTGKDLVVGVANLQRDIADQGDILLVERRAQHLEEKLAGDGPRAEAPPQRNPRERAARPALPDAIADAKRVDVRRPGSGTRMASDDRGFSLPTEPDDFVGR